jgi:regulator of protease activity HflC (stomatin/prohibitin superfamily)
MVPATARRAFSQVVKAQKEGQAALERARGETAALRRLANAAKMIEDNPNLLQLRALQSIADSTGNTLPLTKRTDKKNDAESKMEKDEE